MMLTLTQVTLALLCLAATVNAGSNESGTATIIVKTRPDLAARLNATGLISYGVQINCQKANSITSQSVQDKLQPIQNTTTITAPGCSIDTAWFGKPGAFTTYMLFMYGVNGTQVLCGEFRGTGVRDLNPTINQELNGCPNYDIPQMSFKKSVVARLAQFSGPSGENNVMLSIANQTFAQSSSTTVAHSSSSTSALSLPTTAAALLVIPVNKGQIANAATAPPNSVVQSNTRAYPANNRW